MMTYELDTLLGLSPEEYLEHLTRLLPSIAEELPPPS